MDLLLMKRDYLLEKLFLKQLPSLQISASVFREVATLLRQRLPACLLLSREISKPSKLPVGPCDAEASGIDTTRETDLPSPRVGAAGRRKNYSKQEKGGAAQPT